MNSLRILTLLLEVAARTKELKVETFEKAPAPGYDALENAQGPAPDSAQHLKIGEWRRRIGYMVIAVSAFGLVGTVVAALVLLALWEPKDGSDGPRFWLEIAKLTGKTLATGGLLWVWNQGLRLGERLAIPLWISEERPDAARAMMGVEDGAKALRSEVQNVIELVLKLAGKGKDEQAK